MGNTTSHCPAATGENCNPKTLKKPFQQLLNPAISNSLTSGQRRIIRFIIYYLDWLELPNVDSEALHSRYRAYRQEIKSLSDGNAEERVVIKGQGQYQKTLERDVKRIKDVLKGDGKGWGGVLLTSVEEAFRYGNMPPRFGEDGKRNNGVVMGKNTMEAQIHERIQETHSQSPDQVDDTIAVRSAIDITRPKETHSRDRPITICESPDYELQSLQTLSTNLIIQKSYPSPNASTPNNFLAQYTAQEVQVLKGMKVAGLDDCRINEVEEMLRKRYFVINRKMEVLEKERKMMLVALDIVTVAMRRGNYCTRGEESEY